jgi:hypothetical protein
LIAISSEYHRVRAKTGDFMSNIDYGKLLGFQTVSDHLTGTIDFKDETLGTILGAKVGPPEPVTPPNAAGLDFQNDTLADKLGAKVGFEPGSVMERDTLA